MLTVYPNKSNVCQGIHLFHWAGWRESSRREGKLSLPLSRQTKYSDTAARYFQSSGTVWTASCRMRERRAPVRYREGQTTKMGKRIRRRDVKFILNNAIEREGWRRRLEMIPTTRKLRVSFVRARCKLFMFALNKCVQCTGRGRWIGQCESP